MPVTLNASTASGLIATSDTSGNIELQSNGATKATVSSSGMAIGQYNPSSSLITSGTAVASTSGTSIDFTSLPSWVKRITVNLGGVSTNGSSNLLFQIGSGSVQTTGYLGSGTYQSTSVTFATFTTGVGVRNSIGATAVFHGSLVFVNLTGNTWVGSATFADTSGATNTSAGSVTLSGALDRIRITTVGGTDTFDAGSINILYE